MKKTLLNAMRNNMTVAQFISNTDTVHPHQRTYDASPLAQAVVRAAAKNHSLMQLKLCTLHVCVAITAFVSTEMPTYEDITHAHKHVDFAVVRDYNPLYPCYLITDPALYDFDNLIADAMPIIDTIFSGAHR